MNVKDKIERIKEKAAKVAVKAAAVTTLMTVTDTVLSSCVEHNRNTDENGDKIERVDGTKTSVVFRTTPANEYKAKQILLENGETLSHYTGIAGDDKIHDGVFLEPGDTVTYQGNDIKAVRYKGGEGKQVNFGKIGKIGKDRTD